MDTLTRLSSYSKVAPDGTTPCFVGTCSVGLSTVPCSPKPSSGGTITFLTPPAVPLLALNPDVWPCQITQLKACRYGGSAPCSGYQVNMGTTCRWCCCLQPAAPDRMLARASSTPWHKPPVNGRDPYLNTMGFPLFFVSSNSVPFAVALQIGHKPEPLVKVSTSVHRYGGHNMAPGLPIAILSTLSEQLRGAT
jgi:hypothetical protein